jgi:mannan endo-1,4-beta-mannosidase
VLESFEFLSCAASSLPRHHRGLPSATVKIKSVAAFSLGLLSLAGVLPAAAAKSTANGTRFSIDGVTKYFAGSNAYWISFLTNDADVDLAMGNVARSGLKILRVWGFYDVNQRPSGVWYQQLSSSGSQINTGANGLQRLDAVVRSADKNGVKLIIPFVNYWDDYGEFQLSSLKLSGLADSPQVA